MKKTILSFLAICRAIVLYERMDGEIQLYRNCQNLSQKEFDQPEYQMLSEQHSAFTTAADAIVENYLSHAYSDLFVKLVEKLSSQKGSEEFLGISEHFSQDEVEALLSKAYDKILSIYREKLDEDVEDTAFFKNILKEIVCDVNETIDFACPYCGKAPDIIEAADFFGEDSKYDGKRVCCCECGAYALVNDAGDIIGTMADKELHEKRNRVRSVMSQFNEISGSLYYETRSRVANLIGKSSLNKHTVDYFSTQECNKVIHALLDAMKDIREKSVAFPKCHRDLMAGLKHGARLRIIQDLSAKQNKRLLVPLEVGDASFSVQLRGGGTEIFSFPKGLDYRFEDDMVKIVHPSGKTDEYKFYPKEYRDIPLK